MTDLIGVVHSGCGQDWNRNPEKMNLSKLIGCSGSEFLGRKVMVTAF